MSRRCSTPEADASPDALRRFMYPEEYPCYNLAGDYVPTSGCRERCCVVCPGTPEGEDSPKWTPDSRCAPAGGAGERVAAGAARLQLVQEHSCCISLIYQRYISLALIHFYELHISLIRS